MIVVMNKQRLFWLGVAVLMITTAVLAWFIPRLPHNPKGSYAYDRQLWPGLPSGYQQIYRTPVGSKTPQLNYLTTKTGKQVSQDVQAICQQAKFSYVGKALDNSQVYKVGDRSLRPYITVCSDGQHVWNIAFDFGSNVVAADWYNSLSQDTKKQDLSKQIWLSIDASTIKK